MQPDELLADLDPAQRAAVIEPAQPLAILAPAGSGKTRVLTRRIAWHSATERIEAGHTLALTYTRKAAGELRSRLRHLGVRDGVTAGTFHAIALAQLRRLHDDRGTRMPELLERKARLLGPLVGSITRGKNRIEVSIAITEVASEIEWAKAKGLTPDGYEKKTSNVGRSTSFQPAQIARIFAAYEKEKKSRGLIDFDDIIRDCANALETDAEFRAVQRWRFRHIFVDEFQDATRAQLLLVRAWLGDRSDLCAVGDPDQSIFGFAGAVPEALERFDKWFPGGSTVHLGTNYRSTPQIVAAARAVLPGPDRSPVQASGVDGPVPTIVSYENGEDEAAGVAIALRRAHGEGRRWSDFAVLYRVNAQSVAFEEALHRSGVPFRVRGDAAFLDRPEVLALLDGLHDAARSAPGRRFSEHLTDLVTEAAELGEERRDHAQALATLGREYLVVEGGNGSVAGFNVFLRTSLRGGDDGGIGTDAVELLTFHRAKGLEWDTVFITGLEKGLVPISHAQNNPVAIDEERRLLYVAASRARRELHCSHARNRARGERTTRRSVSPFLADMERGIGIATPAVPAPETNKRNVEKARATLRTDPSGDLDPDERKLYDALVAWRLVQARATQVPAFVILDNKTLAAVARAHPQTPKELLAISGIGEVKLARYGAAVLELIGSE